MKILGFEFGRVKPEPMRFLGDLARILVKDGDVCVLMVPGAVSGEEAEKMRDIWRVAFGEAVSLLVLDRGKRLGVLSPEQATDAAQQIADGKIVLAALEVKP